MCRSFHSYFTTNEEEEETAPSLHPLSAWMFFNPSSEACRGEEDMSRITTQLYLPSGAKKYWGCPKISAVQHRGRGRREEREGFGGDKEDRRAAGARWERRRKRSQLQLATGTLCSPPLPFVLLWFLSLRGDFGRERHRERPHSKVRLQRLLCAASCLCFHVKNRQRRERDSNFKRQFDLRSTQEQNLKEDLRKHLKGEYKGRTVTDAGR